MQMDDEKRIVHALNRFTFGARPSDMTASGLRVWTNGLTNNSIRKN